MEVGLFIAVWIVAGFVGAVGTHFYMDVLNYQHAEKTKNTYSSPRYDQDEYMVMKILAFVCGPLWLVFCAIWVGSSGLANKLASNHLEKKEALKVLADKNA